MSTKINILVKRLEEASYRYYNSDSPLMSDDEFDKLKNELKNSDPSNPFLSKVGAPPLGTKFRHKIPMNSLDNVNNEKEFMKWWNKLPHPREVVIEHKLDGLSIGLEYIDGKLARGLLRGDGIFGEDVIDNIKKSYNNDVISILNNKFNGSIRGEGIIFTDDFANMFCAESNPRNSAVGAIRKENSQKAKWVRIICYDIINDISFNTESEKLEYIKKLGIPTIDYWIFNNADNIIDFYNTMCNKRHELPYEIDGLVIKLNSIADMKNMGTHNNGRPKGATAFKFKCPSATTVLNNITLTNGHTGAIIPTGNVETVTIAGTNVSNVLLNNWDEINRLKIGIGSKIIIEKAGDIIPHVKKVIEIVYKCPECLFVGTIDKQRKHHRIHDESIVCNGKSVELIIDIVPEPTACPACGYVTGRKLNSDGSKTAITYCLNERCDAKSLGKINNWIKKTGIKFFGSARQKICFDAGLISKPADIYKLTIETLGPIVGDGNAINIINEINNHKTLSLDVFMGSLGIKFLGRSNAKKLIDGGINTLDAFRNLQNDIQLDGFGHNNLKEIIDGINDCSEIIDGLIDVGIIITDQASDKIDIKLNVCITGFRLSKDEESFFEERGVLFKSGVSKDLTYLVAKDINSNSSKIKKATKYGIKIITLDEFKNLI